MRRFSTFLTAAVLAAVVSFSAAPAKAGAITTNQWYTAAFTTTDTALFSPPYTDGLDGPVVNGGLGGFASAVDAPAGTDWSITLSGSGTLTVTDVEDSGDYFQMYDNGVLMTAAPSPFTAPGQNPGQVSPGDGLTSDPVYNAAYSYGDINASLGNADFSSATFLLNPGYNDITGIFAPGVFGPGITYGDVNFIAESYSPEPGSLTLLAISSALLLILARRKLVRS